MIKNIPCLKEKISNRGFKMMYTNRESLQMEIIENPKTKEEALQNKQIISSMKRIGIYEE